MSYYDKPILKQPVWIWSVPAYFYVGGAAGAALVLGWAAQLKDRGELRHLFRPCRWIGFLGQAVGSILLIIDLGRPERFHHMMRGVRMTSPLSIGSWILSVGGAASGVSVLLRNRAGDGAGHIAGSLGIPLAGYTGVLLTHTAVPVWKHAGKTLPILFVASAAASAASLLELTSLGDRESRIVHRFGMIGKTAELAAMSAMEHELSGAGKQVKQPLREGIPGALWTTARVLTAASLAVSLIPGGNPKLKRIAGVAGTLGSLGLRFAVFYAGFASARRV